MTTRFDRLVDILGGEQYLPEKAVNRTPTAGAQSSTAQLSATATDGVPAATSENADRDAWWNNLVTIEQPSRSDNGGDGKMAAIHSKNESSMTSTKQSFSSGVDNYCPFRAVTKFCYSHVHPKWSQPIASAFFDQGKIFMRNWNVYYIYSRCYSSDTPVTFVSECEVLQLLDEINEKFPQANAIINENMRNGGFVLNFYDIDCEELRPQFLGRCTSKDQYDRMLDGVIRSPDSMHSNASEHIIDLFRTKMELAIDMSRNKPKASKKKRNVAQEVRLQATAEQLSMVQTYLSPSAHHHATASSSQNIGGNDTLFIALDVEAYERPPHYVTEIGIALLDTRAIRGVSPGENGTNWHQFIRARHLRIREYASFVNTNFVTGCADRFEFGKSEFISKNDMLPVLQTIFPSPQSSSTDLASSDMDRRVLVGHGVSQDIKYLQTVGLDISQYTTLDHAVDTANLFRAHTGEVNSRSLGKILEQFDLIGYNLHNAGNDAVYTLWAMLAIALANGAK